MRRIYACLLHLDGEPAATLPTARALLRQWASTPWGGWPRQLPANEGSFNPDGETVVRWNTLASAFANVRELTIDEPFGEDGTLRQVTLVQTGHDAGNGFVYVDVGIRSTDPTLTGSVSYENAAPSIVPTLVDRLPCLDARTRLRTAAWSLDENTAPAFGRLVMDPARRLPVVVLVLDAFCSADDADEVAQAAAGLAHVACVPRDRVAALMECAGLESAPGISGQLWWASRRAVHGHVPTHHFRNDALTPSRWGIPAWGVLRGLYGVSAFRLTAPPTARRLVAERARQRVADLEQRATLGLADAELLKAYEADLVALEDTQRRVAELEDEVDRLQDDLAGLVAAFDAAVASARRAPVDRAGTGEPRSLSVAVRAAAERCSNLRFLDEAFESAEAWTFRRPAVVLDALVSLDAIAAQWQRDQLPGGFTPAARAIGLPYTPLISRTAQTRFREDYARSYQGGEILLGPHLGWGNTTSNSLRIYLYLDRERRVVVVGHVGEHLRDTTKPHR